MQTFTHLLFFYVFTDATSQSCHHRDEKQRLSFHHRTSLEQSTHTVRSQSLWTRLASATYGKRLFYTCKNSQSHITSQSDYQFSRLQSLWTCTGKSEPFLKGRFRGWINLRAVWSVKWSCRAIFPKISFIRYELLYLRPILGRRLDETPRGPSFHSVIYIQAFDWNIAWQEFVAVELLSPFLCTHTYLNNLFHNVMMSFIIKMLNEIAESVALMIYIFNKVEQFVKWKSVLFVCVFSPPLHCLSVLCCFCCCCWDYSWTLQLKDSSHFQQISWKDQNPTIKWPKSFLCIQSLTSSYSVP